MDQLSSRAPLWDCKAMLPCPSALPASLCPDHQVHCSEPPNIVLCHPVHSCARHTCQQAASAAIRQGPTLDCQTVPPCSAARRPRPASIMLRLELGVTYSGCCIRLAGWTQERSDTERDVACPAWGRAACFTGTLALTARYLQQTQCPGQLGRLWQGLGQSRHRATVASGPLP